MIIVPIIPIIVVRIPSRLECIQPEAEITNIEAIIPIKNENTPISLGSKVSLEVTSKGYPGRAIMTNLVKDITDTIKAVEDKAVPNIRYLRVFLSLLEIISVPKTAAENPPKKAEIKIN